MDAGINWIKCLSTLKVATPSPSIFTIFWGFVQVLFNPDIPAVDPSVVTCFAVPCYMSPFCFEVFWCVLNAGFGLQFIWVFFTGENIHSRLRRVIRESEVGCAFAWERILSVLKCFLCFRNTKLDSHVGCSRSPQVLQIWRKCIPTPRLLGQTAVGCQTHFKIEILNSVHFASLIEHLHSVDRNRQKGLFLKYDILQQDESL